MTGMTIGASGFDWGTLPLHAGDTEAPGWLLPAPVTAFELGTPRTNARHCYPGERPPGSFVVHDSRVFHVRPGTTASGWQVRDDQSIADLDDWLTARGERPLSARLACVGYGSNLHPQQVASIGEDTAVVVLRGVTVGLAAAYCATRRTLDDQYPAGLARADARRVEHHGLLLIDPGQQRRLDRKEGEGTTYHRSTVARPEMPLALILEDGTHLSGGLPVYLQDDENRPLALNRDAFVLLADVHEREIFDSTPAASTPRHGLHATRLTRLPTMQASPLPVFAYGTLRPGHSRWPFIEHLVEAHEPGTIHGHRIDTGHGFPGLLLDDPEGDRVEGDVLHLIPATFRQAIDLMDRIEGHPDLFARHLVRTDGGVLCWTYIWLG